MDSLLTPAQRRVVWLALPVYVVALLVLTFQPSGAAAGQGVTWAAELLTRLHVPTRVVERTEVLLNVVMLVPLPVLGLLLAPRTNWRDWTAYAFLVSLTIELIQVPLPTRDASFSDLASNTAGAALGGLLMVPVLAWLRHRRARELAAAETSDGRLRTTPEG